VCVCQRGRKEEDGVKEADLRRSAYVCVCVCVCVCVFSVGVRELVLSQHEQEGSGSRVESIVLDCADGQECFQTTASI